MLDSYGCYSSFSIYLLWKYLVFVYSLSIICVLFYKWSGCKSLLGLLLSLHVCCLLSEVAVYMNTTEVLWHSLTVLVICWVSFIHLTIPIHSVEWKSSLFKFLNFKSGYVLIWAKTLIEYKSFYRSWVSILVFLYLKCQVNVAIYIGQCMIYLNWALGLTNA